MSAYVQFGIGFCAVSPYAGNLATNPTPLHLLTTQDASLDSTSDVKELRGQNQYPDDVAPGDRKGTGKLGTGRKDLNLFNQIMFADTVVTGGASVSYVESHTIPATPYQIVVTPPNSGTFSEDLGVSFGANINQALTKVASSPATGQYSVSSGTYTFAAADTTKVVLISYSYTNASTGQTYQVNNQLLGYGPVCEVWIVDSYQPGGSGLNVFNTIRVAAARFTKITQGNKRDDYAKPELDFSFFNASNNRILDMYSVNG